MNINVQIDEVYAGRAAQQVLERAAQTTLQHHPDFEPGDITIVVTGSEAVKELNRDYLGIDAPTDVLSFPSHEIDPETNTLYLGDIIIAFPVAEAQSLVEGHPVEAELQLLVVHGVLHLLGFDHADEKEQSVMWVQQAAVLANLGNSLSPAG
jgi:probable rRNA maturation factor